jgi:hypothetical protein
MVISSTATKSITAKGKLSFLDMDLVETPVVSVRSRLSFLELDISSSARLIPKLRRDLLLSFVDLTIQSSAHKEHRARGRVRAPRLEGRWAGGKSTFLSLLVSGTGSLAGSVLTAENTAAYVLNMTTAETTVYSNYPFRHIIHVGGTPYGVTATGLYHLAGGSDAGVPIVGTITTKETDLGQFQSKYVPTVYLNSDTTIDVAPYVDAELKPTYKGSFDGRKCHLARGLAGRYWRFKLLNIKMLEGLEILPETKQRRVK